MRALVLELLDLAKHEVVPGKHDIGAPVDLSATTETAVLTFEAVAYEGGLTMEAQVEENLTVRGDGQQMAQLLHILLDNAVKYSLPESEIGVTLKDERGKYARLSVTNRSEKLENEEIKKLFDRFYRVDKARSLKPGYGLGLSVARQIVERHGGKIRAEHRDGVTRFVVKLSIDK